MCRIRNNLIRKAIKSLKNEDYEWMSYFDLADRIEGKLEKRVRGGVSPLTLHAILREYPSVERRKIRGVSQIRFMEKTVDRKPVENLIETDVKFSKPAVEKKGGNLKWLSVGHVFYGRNGM